MHVQQAMEELRRVASGDAELEDLNLEGITGGELRAAPPHGSARWSLLSPLT